MKPKKVRERVIHSNDIIPISSLDDEEREYVEHLVYGSGELEDDYSEESSP